MSQIDAILKLALTRKASDIHLSATEPARLRIDGELEIVENSLQEPDDLQKMILEVLSDTERNRFLKNKNLDKSYHAKGIGNFRMNVFLTRRGIASVLRVIPDKIPTMKELNLPQSIGQLIHLEKGLVLVTGPTGVGKSTTLASMISEINATSNSHIMTIEDPVEFIHKSQKSLVNQREIGTSCDTFADALKYALREDPDAILVGEMRDMETIELALTAAETGHLVFGTLHTRGAASSIDRIINSFPADKQPMVRMVLSGSLQAVISQQLLRRADGKGRVAAFEIMTNTNAISNLIREGKTFQINSAIQTARKDGMILMDQYIVDLVKQGLVSSEVAEGYLDNPTLLGGVTRSAPPREDNATVQKDRMAKMPPPTKVHSFQPLAVEAAAEPSDSSVTIIEEEVSQVDVVVPPKKAPMPPPFPKKKTG